MPSEFTEHLKSVLDGTSGVNNEILQAIEKPILRELARRNLLDVPAEKLALAGKCLGKGDALRHLAINAYAELFAPNARRFRELRVRLEAGNPIDGIVVKELRRFVHRIHDTLFPESCGVFANVLRAGRYLVEESGAKVTLVGDEANAVRINHRIGPPHSRLPEAKESEVKNAVERSSGWSATLLDVRDFSKKGWMGVAIGILELFEQEIHPLSLKTLQTILLALAPVQRPDLPKGDAEIGETGDFLDFFRTIQNDDACSTERILDEENLARAFLAIDRCPHRAKTREDMKRLLKGIVSWVRNPENRPRFTQARLAEELQMAPQTLSDVLAKLSKCLGELDENN